MARTRIRCSCSKSCRKAPTPKRSSSCSARTPRSRAGSSASSICRGAAPATPGLTNGYVSQDIQGQVPGTEIFYSIQGNILRPGEVVPNAVKAFLRTTGAITDRVMAAMEAADGSGGDSRCVCPPRPTDGIRAGDSVRRQDVARRLHPGRRPQRHQRRLAQQRQVRDVPHGVAARGQGPNADPGGREPQPGEDAARALRRVEEGPDRRPARRAAESASCRLPRRPAAAAADRIAAARSR